MEEVRKIHVRTSKYKCRDCRKTIKFFDIAYETVESEEIICSECYKSNEKYKDVEEI